MDTDPNDKKSPVDAAGSDGDAQTGKQPEDPLDGVDVGEIVTVREEQTLYTIDYEPDVFVGRDRFAQGVSVDSVEIKRVEDGSDKMQVTWEGEVLKTVPRGWDDQPEPDTPTARGRESDAVKQLVGIGIGLSIGFGVAWWLMRTTLTTDLTINGEAVGPPSIWSVVLIGVVMAIIVAAMSVLPRLGDHKGGLY